MKRHSSHHSSKKNIFSGMKFFAFLTIFLILAGFSGLFAWFTNWLSPSIANAPKIVYWDKNGKFAYSGGLVSTLSGSQNFSGQRAIFEIKSLYSLDSDPLRYYIEYPNFSEISNLTIVNWLQEKMRELSHPKNNFSASGSLQKSSKKLPKNLNITKAILYAKTKKKSKRCLRQKWLFIPINNFYTSLIIHMKNTKKLEDLLLQNGHGAMTRLALSLGQSESSIIMVIRRWIKKKSTQKRYTKAFNATFNTNFTSEEIFNNL